MATAAAFSTNLATSVGSSHFINGGSRLNTPKGIGFHGSLIVLRQKANPRRFQNLVVRSEYHDDSSSGSSDFLAGFLLGGIVFGALGYVFAPQIRRSLLNEDESGFRRARQPIYYDEGLEKTRQTLNAKIRQLNSAIDSVSSRLRGGGGGSIVVPERIETDPEVEASI